jgi:hypothetical protein
MAHHKLTSVQLLGFNLGTAQQAPLKLAGRAESRGKREGGGGGGRGIGRGARLDLAAVEVARVQVSGKVDPRHEDGGPTLRRPCARADTRHTFSRRRQRRPLVTLPHLWRELVIDLRLRVVPEAQRLDLGRPLLIMWRM